MANITAAAVNELRQATGCGLMDCKKALVECEGDFDKAVTYLREKGLASAAKKATRVAAEGMAYADVIDGVGVIVEVNCESDFVAGGPLFAEFVSGVAKVIAKCAPADVDALMAAPWHTGEGTVAVRAREHEHPPLRARRGRVRALRPHEGQGRRARRARHHR